MMKIKQVRGVRSPRCGKQKSGLLGQPARGSIKNGKSSLQDRTLGKRRSTVDQEQRPEAIHNDGTEVELRRSHQKATDIQSPSLGHAGWRRGSLGAFVVIPETKQKQFLTLKEPGVTVAGSHLKRRNRGTFLVISKTEQ